ncbi:MAG: hypothetical protein ACYSU0_20665 [Planctomycetota bacterium]
MSPSAGTAHKGSDVVRQALEAIALASGGVLTPEGVVNAARDPQHPLHSRFIWDDAIAAHAHRIETARRIIRSVKTEIQTTTYGVVVPIYLRDPDRRHDEQGYRPTVDIRTDQDVARSAMIAELRRVQAALERARAVAEALGYLDDLEDLLAHTAAFRSTVEGEDDDTEQ